MALSDDLRTRISTLITQHHVVLFMKGTRRAPACGFSAGVVQVLDELVPEYETVNVLEDPSLREGIKEFSEWPTIPQLYVAGQFVGGADIVRDLAASGELAQMLAGAPAPAEVPAPSITVTDAAAAAFREALREASPEERVRLEISPQFQYDLAIGPREPGDVEVTANGLAVVLDRASARRADGTTIDFLQGANGAGFKIESANAPPRVKQMTPAELKALLDQNAPLELFDVRTPGERAIAALPRARLLDQGAQDYLLALPKDTRIVFHCHHGGRSQAAAEHFLRQGFKNVYNLAGGIDAWSQTIDPNVPRY